MAMNRKARRTAAKQIRSVDIKGASESTLDLMIDKALEHAGAGRWQEAEGVLRQIVAAHPGNAEALHQLGIALGRLGRAVEGIDFLRKATELKPAEALYWNNLAVCLLGAAQHRDAADAARKAVAIDPNYGMAWDSLGDALTAMQDFAAAKNAYERSIAIKGADIVSLKRLANCQMNTGELGNAERRLTQALGIAPDDIEVLSNLGSVLVALDRPADALVHLAPAAERVPDKFSVAYNFARALAGVGQTEKAVRWFRRATSIEHRNPGPWQHLGELLLKSGEFEEAEAAAKRARDLSPGATAPAELLQRISAARNPVEVSAKKDGPLMWDFHLGDGGAAQTAGSLDVSFEGAKVNGSSVGLKKPAIPRPEKPAEAKPGIVDLSILKIGN